VGIQHTNTGTDYFSPRKTIPVNTFNGGG